MVCTLVLFRSSDQITKVEEVILSRRKHPYSMITLIISFSQVVRYCGMLHQHPSELYWFPFECLIGKKTTMIVHVRWGISQTLPSVFPLIHKMKWIGLVKPIANHTLEWIFNARVQFPQTMPNNNACSPHLVRIAGDQHAKDVEALKVPLFISMNNTIFLTFISLYLCL